MKTLLEKLGVENHREIIEGSKRVDAQIKEDLKKEEWKKSLVDIRNWELPEGVSCFGIMAPVTSWVGTPIPWGGANPRTDETFIFSRYSAAGWHNLCSDEIYGFERLNPLGNSMRIGQTVFTGTKFYDKKNVVVDPKTGFKYTSLNQTVLDILDSGADEVKTLESLSSLQLMGQLNKVLSWCLRHGLEKEKVDCVLEKLNNPEIMEFIH